MPSHKKIIITSGDEDGIGLEVSAKALCKIGPSPETQFILFVSYYHNKKEWLRYLSHLCQRFHVLFFETLDEALSCGPLNSSSHKELLIIRSKQAPALWVEESAKSCLSGKASGLVTGPLSKPGIKSSGLSDLGHTEILKRVCRIKKANMAFLGKAFNVVLASAHIPLQKVEKSLCTTGISSAVKNADELRKHLPKGWSQRPIAILGLNPHAGDSALIGNFEKTHLAPEIKRLRHAGFLLSDPLVPDVAFQPQNLKKYSIFISMYHDQGLIPFKMVHGFAGAHLTLGLPIWRTSVDHGTAKDLFGLNKANPASMIEAIRWSLKLVKATKVKVAKKK